MTETKNNKKMWGISLVVVPIVLWFVVALANGFDFSHPWFGSGGTDLLLGIMAVVVVIIGVTLIATSADEQK